jgi:hypothetical protein
MFVLVAAGRTPGFGPFRRRTARGAAINQCG